MTPLITVACVLSSFNVLYTSINVEAKVFPSSSASPFSVTNICTFGQYLSRDFVFKIARFGVTPKYSSDKVLSGFQCIYGIIGINLSLIPL